MSRSSPASSNVTARLAENRLGMMTIIQFALGAAAPLTVVGGIVPTAYATTGIIGIPLAFLICGAFLTVWCVGYNAMSRRISNAGALYAYISQGLGKPVGVGAAYVAWLSYNMFQTSAYGLFGVTAKTVINPLIGYDFAWWAYAAVAWFLVGTMGLFRVDINGSILGVLMLAEIVVIIVFDLGDLAHPAGGVISVATLAPSTLLVSTVGAAMVVAITGFTGFENAAYYSEEAKNRKKTVPAATYLCIVVITVLYSGSSWAMSVATGPDHIVDAAGKSGGELVFTLAADNLGHSFSLIGHVLLMTSVFAAMVAFHNASARYAFALGREGVVPKLFGRVSARSCAPKWGSFAQTVVGAAVIAGYAITGGDPLVQLFFWLGATGGFGVLVLLTVTSAAVIGYFVRHNVETRWRALYAPAISLFALAAAVVGAYLTFTSLLGVDATSPLGWIFPASFVVIGGIGVVWALVLARTRPEVYARIGQGVSTTANARPDASDPLAIGDHELGGTSL